MKPSKLSFYKVLKVSIFLGFGFIAGLTSLSACQTKQPPSILVIAVDRLSFNSFSCNDERSSSLSGLNMLCKEALRFTHAYTTSIQSAAAIGSILTGQYPFIHQIHRSPDRIHSKLKMLSEIALENKYRTSLLSGSPALLKKSGLSKGFELFDDLSLLDRKNYLSDFNQQKKTFMNWLKESSEPFFSLIYNSELESLNEGETEISTFEKFDEKLSYFFGELKQNNQWENNFIIVVGLQGDSDYSRPNESLSSNLHSENTNILLFIKPPRQMGDEGVHWKIDSSVNLADLGLSLMKTIDPNWLAVSDDQFKVSDFSFLWKKNQTDFDQFEDRKILIESINTWNKKNETRYSIVYKNLIHIESKSDELYNTLTDGLETINIAPFATDAQINFMNENRQLWTALRKEYNQLKWTHFISVYDPFILSNREYWSKPNTRLAVLEKEYLNYKKTKKSQPLTALMLQNFIATHKIDLINSLNLKIDHKILNFEKEKEIFFDEARRESINLSIENAWGLWESKRNWTQSTFIKEYQ